MRVKDFYLDVDQFADLLDNANIAVRKADDLKFVDNMRCDFSIQGEEMLISSAEITRLEDIVNA